MATKTMSTSTYRDVLKRAFKITKEHKFLWFFGFFAAFLGVGGELEPLFKYYTEVAETSQGVFSLQSIFQGGLITSLLGNTKLFFSTYPVQAFFFLLMILVIAIVLLWLAIVSQIALFDAAKKITSNKQLNYHDSYKAGNQHFGSVLLINIIVKVVLYGLVIVIGAPLLTWFLLQNNIWGAFLFILLIFFILIPASIIISFIVRYAIAYIVIKGEKTGQAVSLAWSLFKKNWLISIEMALIILVIGVCVGLVMAIVIGLASIPFIFIGIAALFFGSSVGLSVAIVLGTVTWSVIVAVLGAAYVTFQYTAWALLFLRLDSEKAQSKLMRWFGKLTPSKA